MHDLITWSRTHFLPRWLVANVIGWSLGLYLGGGLLSLVGGIGGALLGGALAGLIVGAAQWWVLRVEPGQADPRWAWLSALGGGLATLPAYIAGAALIAGPQVGYFVVGAVYGGIFGGLQWLALRRTDSDRAGLWLAANLLAGGLCGCLTMTATLPGLPLVCSPGPVIFGLLTGYAMQWMRRATPPGETG